MSVLTAIDATMLLYIQEHLRADIWSPVWTLVTALGDGGFIWILISALLLIPRRTREIGIASLLSMGLCFVCSNLLLKNLFARVRPFDAVEGLIALIPHPSDYSFPSGHTTASFACALVLLRTLPKRYGVAALILAVMIAFSRLYVGVHYPSDILGGFAVALAGSTLALFLCKKRLLRAGWVRGW